MLISVAAFAEEALLDRLGLERMEELSREINGPDVRDIAQKALSGELSINGGTLKRVLRKVVTDLRGALTEALRLLALPVLATLLLQLMLDRTDGALKLLCRMACACGLARQCAGAMETASTALGVSAKIADTASPVLAAALTLTGEAATAATLSPLAALCVSLIETLFLKVGLPLCAAAAIVVCGGNLSERFRLDRLFALICRAAVWGVRLTLIAFVGLLAVQGRLAATRDSASANAVGQALRGMVPIIGRSVSDTTGALIESAAAVRAAVGATGMILALAACAAPALRLAVYMLSIRLAAAVIEPVADPGIGRIAAGFAEIARVLLALCVAGAMLSALLAGTCLGLV